MAVPHAHPHGRASTAMVVDHQGKSLPVTHALTSLGVQLVDDPRFADFVLIDHDYPPHGRLPIVEACVAAGGRAYIYPHGANANLMTHWDGLVPVSPLLSGVLVTSYGHAEVARRFGYEHPVFVVGWTFCEQRERKPLKPGVERVLFGPAHPPWATDRNTEIFARLREIPAQLAVRHIGSLEENRLPAPVEGVEYLAGTMHEFDTMLAQIDAADVVVSDQGTFSSLAVARGVPTVIWDSDFALNNEGDREALNAARYRSFMRYPFDAEDGDLWDVIQAAAADVERAADWRARFIGDPLDPRALLRALLNGPYRATSDGRPAEEGDTALLHAGALAHVQVGRFDAADALATRAVAGALDLELLNDLAVIRANRGLHADAEALLRACLALDPERIDARENLAALRDAA